LIPKDVFFLHSGWFWFRWGRFLQGHPGWREEGSLTFHTVLKGIHRRWILEDQSKNGKNTYPYGQKGRCYRHFLCHGSKCFCFSFQWNRFSLFSRLVHLLERTEICLQSFSFEVQTAIVAPQGLCLEGAWHNSSYSICLNGNSQELGITFGIVGKRETTTTTGMNGFTHSFIRLTINRSEEEQLGA